MGFLDAIRLSTMFAPTRSKTLNQSWSPAGESKPSPWSWTDFGGNNPITQEEIQEPDNSVDSYMRRMREIENSPTPALEKYRKHLESIPKEEDYRPGVMGRIAAALGGASAGWRSGAGAGIETAVKMNRMPYENALDTWGLQGKGLKEESDLEVEAQRDKMRNLQAAMTNDLNWAKFRDTSARGWETTKNTRDYQQGNLKERGRTNDINARRVGAYETDVKNRGTYQQGQLGIGRQRNSIYQTSVNNQKTLGDERNSIARDRVAKMGNKPATPINQRVAQDMALEEMAKDPLWSQRISQVGADNLGRPVYDYDTTNPAFVSELESRKRKILAGGSGAANPQSPDDDDESMDDSEDEYEISGGW